MFGKMKEATGGGSVQKAADAIAPKLHEHLEKTVGDLSPQAVQDDESYHKVVVSPALMVASGASGGVTSMIPGFKDKFGNAMLHLRDELLVCDDSSVTLADDAKERLPSVLVAGLKQ